ncbi:hypothetical protein L6452_31783 [Arctium lappa]|uniref:Uncharacterized protein n=1 Tax=Arctium lappa TaxID=4217 RepID=A0ACB8Z1Z3_ARCLA|nr:hypothetical protein L6452_31783 [Arctium lappa]
METDAMMHEAMVSIAETNHAKSGRVSFEEDTQAGHDSKERKLVFECLTQTDTRLKFGEKDVGTFAAAVGSSPNGVLDFFPLSDKTQTKIQIPIDLAKKAVKEYNTMVYDALASFLPMGMSDHAPAIITLGGGKQGDTNDLMKEPVIELGSSSTRCTRSTTRSKEVKEETQRTIAQTETHKLSSGMSKVKNEGTSVHGSQPDKKIEGEETDEMEEKKGKEPRATPRIQ